MNLTRHNKRSAKGMLLLMLFAVLLPMQAYAHKPITEREAITKALRVVEGLAHKGDIDASWIGIMPSSAKRVKKGKTYEWMVVIKNPGLQDEAKRTLYVFFAYRGEYLRANHSGK